MSFKQQLQCLLVVIFGITGILAAVAFAATWIYPVPMDYVVLAEFRELPADDKKLEEWLLSQPGVYIGFVNRSGNKVSAVWGHSQNRYYHAVTPDLRDQFEKLGYKV